MENLAEETLNDHCDMKEKVRVVRLDDPTINTKSNIGLGNINSSASVWSLCDINNDDSHVDLGDITPSISPVFTEEQVLELTEQQIMVDPMTHRLLDDGDTIFSVENIEHSLQSGQQKGSPLHDFPSDLEIFNSEMKKVGELDGVARHGGHLNLNEIGLAGGEGKPSSVNKGVRKEKGAESVESRGSNEPNASNKGVSPPKTTQRRSPRKPVTPESGIALRTRNKSSVQPVEGKRESLIQKGELALDTTAKNSEQEKKVLQDKVKKGPSRRSSRIAKHVETEVEKESGGKNDLNVETSEENVAVPLPAEIEITKQGENVSENKIDVSVKGEKEPTVNETVPEKIKEPERKVPDVKPSDAKPADIEKPKEKDERKTERLIPGTPEKRVTRSRTGNLKPKQAFDELQEKLEAEQARRMKEKAKESEKLKAQEQNIVENDGSKDDKIKSSLETEAKSADQGNAWPKTSKSPQKNKQDGVCKIRSSVKKEQKKPGSKPKDEQASKGLAELSESASESESSDGEVDFHADDSDYSPEDDPSRLWCICRKPHGNRFMICCDGCEEWFHGKCVGITMEQGRKMEKNGREYVCTKCKEKRAEKPLMDEKGPPDPAKAAAKPAFIREVYKSTRQNQKEEPTSSSDVKPSSTVAAPHADEKKRKPKEPVGFKIPKKVRTTPTPPSHSHQPAKKCIAHGCPRTSFEGAVYCGRSCIERHVSQAVKMLPGKEHGRKSLTSEGNRVAVIEKSSGRVIAGMAAPVMNNLTDWIVKNPSFQVLVAGASSAAHSTSSFYNKPHAEPKVKKEVDRKTEVETIRSNVRRTMKEILVTRKKESTDIRISVEEIIELVSTIEEGMHKEFKDTSHRYKAKYRTLMFNLKDPRNKVLYRRVLTGDIPPEKLIWMTSDELATKELAEWREQETKHMIDMIKKEEENPNKTRLIKKTHKGEVDMEGGDDLSTLESSNTKDESDDGVKSEIEENQEVQLVDTTEEHRAHLFDLNCKICTGKIAPPGFVAKSPQTVASSVPVQAATESSIPSPPREVSIAGPTSPYSGEFATTSSNPKVRSKQKEKTVWKGFVMMQSVAKFGTNAYLVSGSAEDLIQVLPDTLHVHGRIAHEQVWDYVLQCKTSSSREMCLIRFAAATDEEKISYVSLYSYFHSRKRCGVIGNCYSGVKDMYLIPLASHQPVPPELLPFKGPGLQEPRPHMLLGLIIRSKVGGKRARSSIDRIPSTSPRSAGEPPTKQRAASANGPDTSKPTTPTSKSTTPTLPDSPVDEIEDIVFHFHNSQAKLETEAANKPKPSSTEQIAPMVSTLLKIQEQEKKLRALQEQSERLEKEMAPKPVAFPASISSVLSRLAGSVSNRNNSTKAAVAKQEPEKPSGAVVDSDNLYDPETAYDEETPYDPDDLDLNLKAEGTADVKSDETGTVKSLSSTTGIAKSSSYGAVPEVSGKTKHVAAGISSALPPLLAPEHSQIRPGGERVRPGSGFGTPPVADAQRTVPRPLLEEFGKRSLPQRPASSDVHPRVVPNDPRSSRFRNVPAQDTSSQSRDLSDTRDLVQTRQLNDEPRRDADESKSHPSKSRPSERRWSDDRGRDRHDSHRQRDDRLREERPRDDRPRDERPRDDRLREERPRDDRQREERPRDDRQREERPRDDRQRGFVDRDRGHDRDRHLREKWRR